MKFKFHIINFIGFTCLIVGFFLDVSTSGQGDFLKGFGAGLVLAGSFGLIAEYIHKRNSGKITPEQAA